MHESTSFIPASLSSLTFLVSIRKAVSYEAMVIDTLRQTDSGLAPNVLGSNGHRTIVFCDFSLSDL